MKVDLPAANVYDPGQLYYAGLPHYRGDPPSFICLCQN